MVNKFSSKINPIIYTLLFIVILTARAFAGEYAYTYSFNTPQILTLENGLQIVQFQDTWQKDDIIGAPIVPVKTAKIFIPADETLTAIDIKKGDLESINGNFTLQHATRPYPLSFKGTITPDPPDQSIYGSNQEYPTTLSIEKGSQFLKGTQIVLVDLIPVVYTPGNGQIHFYRQMTLTIQTEKGQRPAGARSFRNLPGDRKKILNTVDNANDFLSVHASGPSEEAYTPLATRDYIVITADALQAPFQALASHRQSAAGGSFTTHIETIENIRAYYSGVDDAEKMRSFIIDMYENHGTQYVVLGGDCDGPHGSQAISTRGCYALVNGGSPPDDDPDHYIPSDLYFGCLDGSWNNDGDGLWGESNDGVGGADIDWYSEVFVGRIPADSIDEATRQIDKIIAYETGSPAIKTLLVGEQLDATPTWGGDRIDWVYGFMNAVPKTQLYDRDHASNNWPKSDLLAQINTNDHNWLNHLGHGNPVSNMKLGNADIGSMTNTRYFFSYSQACYSASIDGRWWGGSYNSGDSIMEDMVNSNTHGAFAFIGNARYGWYNSGAYVQGASNLAHKEFAEAVFTDGFTRLGEANQKSKTDLNLASGLYRWIAFETNLIGCPATQILQEDVCPPAIEIVPDDLEINLNQDQTGQLTLNITNTGCQPLAVSDICDDETLPAKEIRKIQFPSDMPQLASLSETMEAMGLSPATSPAANGDILSQCASGVPGSVLMGLYYRPATDTLYVISEFTNGLIHLMDESCNLTGSLPSPSNELNGITFDGTSLWVTDFYGPDGNSDWLYKLDPSTGEVLGSWDVRPSGITGVAGIAWDGQNLWVASFINSTLYKLDAGLTIMDSFAVAWTPTGLTWDGSNLISVDYSGNLHRVSTNGTLLDSMAGPSGSAFGITCGTSGLWHSEFATDTLYLLESDWCNGGLCENDAPWLSTAPTSGSLNPGETMVVDVNFDATGMAQDIYTAVLRIRSNDPDQEVVEVPVTMDVRDFCECDLNTDGSCDMQDWLIFGEDWGRSDCPVPALVSKQRDASPLNILNLNTPADIPPGTAAFGDPVDCACNGDYVAGDRVVALVDSPTGAANLPAGSMGTVICGNPADIILISWDDWQSGHNGNGFCECPVDALTDTSGWWVSCDEIAPAEHDICECDLNQDGSCDMQDWLIFGEDWGRSDCPL